jgi:hypothetical protein
MRCWDARSSRAVLEIDATPATHIFMLIAIAMSASHCDVESSRSKLAM